MKETLILSSLLLISSACGPTDNTSDTDSNNGKDGKGDLIVKTDGDILFATTLPSLGSNERTSSIWSAVLTGDSLVLKVKASSCDVHGYKLHIAESDEAVVRGQAPNYVAALECTSVIRGLGIDTKVTYDLKSFGQTLPEGETKITIGKHDVVYKIGDAPASKEIILDVDSTFGDYVQISSPDAYVRSMKVSGSTLTIRVEGIQSDESGKDIFLTATTTSNRSDAVSQLNFAAPATRLNPLGSFSGELVFDIAKLSNVFGSARFLLGHNYIQNGKGPQATPRPVKVTDVEDTPEEDITKEVAGIELVGNKLRMFVISNTCSADGFTLVISDSTSFSDGEEFNTEIGLSQESSNLGYLGYIPDSEHCKSGTTFAGYLEFDISAWKTSLGLKKGQRRQLIINTSDTSSEVAIVTVD